MAAEDSSLKAVQVKLVLLGEAAVGKSSLVLRFVHNDFNENTSPTIGAAFLTQKCRLENRVVKFEIWDTAGQERFMSLAPMYYRNSAASVVVYDITKTSSFEKAKAWVKELKRQANPNIVIALVGNKLDLVEGSDGETAPKDDSAVEIPAAAADEGADDDDATPPPPSPPPAAADGPRQVSTAEAKAYADENGLLFFEASAKTGTNVQNIFIDLAKTIPFETVAAKPAAGAAHGRRSAANAAANDSGRVQLGDEPVAKKGGCC